MARRKLGPEQLAAARADLTTAASSAADRGEEVYLAATKDDARALRDQGKCAAWVPNELPLVELVGAVDAAPSAVVVRHPHVQSRGKVRAMLSRLEEAPHLRRGETLEVALTEAGMDAAAAEGQSVDELLYLDDFPCRWDEAYHSAEDRAAEEVNDRGYSAVRFADKFKAMYESRDDVEGVARAEFLSKDAMRDLLANEQYLDDDGKRRPIFDAWLRSPSRRTFDGVEFAPEGLPADSKRLNLWRGFRYEPRERPGGWSLLQGHLLDNVCGGDIELYKWLHSWMAQLVQCPAERPGTALVLIGEQGAGKSVVGQVLGHLLHPDHYVCVKHRRHLTGNFNAHLAGKLLVQAEETFWAGDREAASVLKSLITEDRTLLELKGVDAVPVRNLARVLITSNEEWVVPAAVEERRFAIFRVGNGARQDRAFFGALLAQLRDGGYAALHHDLLQPHVEVAGQRYALADPAIVPRTAALREQKLASLDTVGRWWVDRLDSGGFGGQAEVWPAEVPKQSAYEDYRREARALGRGAPVSQVDFGRKLRELCPTIADGRQATGGRLHTYLLPSLDECRAQLEARLAGPS